jgi:hypothetical protein
VAIPHPVGSITEDSYEAEMEIRMEILERALNALCTPITEQTVFRKGEQVEVAGTEKR